MIRRAYENRIYPTEEQAIILLRWEGSLRFLWNLANEQYMQAFSRCRVDRHWPTAMSQMYELTPLRDDLPWLADVPRDACNQVLIRLDQAWQRYFLHLAEKPQFKCKYRDAVSICSPDTRSFRVEGEGRLTNLIFFKTMLGGPIKIRQHRPTEGKVKSCTITRDVDQWFASFSCEIEVPDPLPSTLPAVAIDRGVTDLLADSNGRCVENPRCFKKGRDKLAALQADAANKGKGSKNKGKAKVKVARQHRKIRRQREAVLHRESLYYAKNHGTVVIERLDIGAMTASASGTVEEPGTNVAQKRGLNRAILDSGWGEFARMTEYKLIPRGGNVEKVSAYKSSITCGECGKVHPASRNGKLFHCVFCGHEDDADVNAAKVLLKRRRTDGVGLTGAARPRKQLRVVRRGTRRITVGKHQGSTPEAPAVKPG